MPNLRLRFSIAFLYWLVVFCEYTTPGSACDGDCIFIGDCEYFTPLTIQTATLVYCDYAKLIVCCPRKKVDSGERYYQDIAESVFQHNCKQYYTDVYKECKPQPLIIGGSNADLDEFPFMALIAQKLPKFKPICGGTLLSPKFVLTAAHCYYDSVIPDMVRLGELDYSTTADGAKHMDFDILDFKCHPEYDFDNRDKHNDIALVELTTAAPFSEHIAPACLPLSNGTNFDKLIIAGWGSNKTASVGVPHLQKAYVDRYDDELCSETFKLSSKNIRASTQICAISNKSDTCNGDSGGPLFVNHPDFPCMYIVLGITSYGFSCGVHDVPAAYTRVNLFIKWIETTVWNLTDANFR